MNFRGSKEADEVRIYDLKEPSWPLVDSLLLELIEKTVFTLGDFIPGNDGGCRLHQQLARYVVIACRLADMIVQEQARWLHLPTHHHDGPCLTPSIRDYASSPI